MSATITDMAKPPCDAFGEYLANLRKQRGISARGLSQALGLSEAYIYKWEHESRVRVTRTVLERVVTELDVSEDERQELFRLADLRDAPETAKHLYESSQAGDPDRNLLHALLEIEHDWPSEPSTPNPHSTRARLLLDAASWPLARIAAHCTEALRPFAHVRWPQPLIDLGIVPAVDSEEAIAIPDALVEEELPFVHLLKDPVTPKDVDTQSLAMARTYKRLLFSDAQRARAALEPVQRWSYDRTQDLAECLSITFKTTDIDKKAGFQDVTCSVVEAVGHRDLAKYLWVMGNDLPGDQPPARWYAKATESDTAAMNALAYLFPAELKSYELGQNLRDAFYCVRSASWATAQQSLCKHYGMEYGSAPKLESELRANPRLFLHGDEGRNPAELVTVPKELIEARARAALSFIPALEPVARTTESDGEVSRSELDRRMSGGTEPRVPNRKPQATSKRKAKATPKRKSRAKVKSRPKPKAKKKRKT